MNYKEKYKNDVLSKLTPNDKFNQITAKLDLNNSIKTKGEKNYMKKGLLIASSAVCLTLIVGLGTYFLVNKDNGATTAPAMVKMNLNPSITFMVDEDNKVISVSGENNEGKMIIANEQIVGKTLDEAIEIVLNIENETGYLISGNASINDNNLSFSITVDDEETKNILESNINKTVIDVCEDLNVVISDKITYTEAYSKTQLQEIVLKIDPSLTEEDVSSMTYEQMFDVINLYNIETAEIYSDELLQLYNQTKEYEFMFAESQFTKELISELGSAQAAVLNVFMDVYNTALNALNSAIDSLNDARYNYFISEESLYQKAYDSILQSKQEVLSYKNQLAQLETEDEETKAQLQDIIDAKIVLLDQATTNLQTAKVDAEKILDSLETSINEIISNLETTKNNIVSLLQINLEEELTNKASELDAYLNQTKTDLFAEFEEKYADDIAAAKNEILAYKESLKNSTTTVE